MNMGKITIFGSEPIGPDMESFWVITYKITFRIELRTQ
jgi:hypothetical protein